MGKPFVFALLIFSSATGHAQTICHNALLGQVADPSGAVVVHATISIDGVEKLETDKAGQFTLHCAPSGSHRITIRAATFAEGAQQIRIAAEGNTQAKFVLQPAQVLSEVGVDASQSDDGDEKMQYTGRQLDAFADDPEDLLRQLQSLGALSGALPDNVRITVNGFQQNSTLPPKNTIGQIRVNPDLFSSEFPDPPFEGANVEVYTKAGQSAFHGQIFTNLGVKPFNAADPFSPSKAPIGKTLIGGNVGGPLVGHRADFSLGLEHRSIDSFAVVNATTLALTGNPIAVNDNVKTPQTMWLGNGRVNYQINDAHLLFANFSVNTNDQENVGTGGLVTEEAGYTASVYDISLQMAHIAALSPSRMNELRVALRSTLTQDSPNCHLRALSIAGYAVSGGADIQNTSQKERSLEIDDNFTFSREFHQFRAGLQLNVYGDSYQFRQGTNGSLLFGGVTNGSTALTALEQYRRYLSGDPAVNPTSYTLTIAYHDPHLTQTQLAGFAQEQRTLRGELQISAGIRYSLQTTPGSYGNVVARFGAVWNPHSLHRLTLSAHSGLFRAGVGRSVYAEFARLNGIDGRSSVIYSPVGPGLSGRPIVSLRSAAASLGQSPFAETQVGAQLSLPHKWAAQTSVYLIQGWNLIRSRNSNSPLTSDPYGIRLGPPDTNVLNFQQTGHTSGTMFVASISKSGAKFLSGSLVYVRNGLQSNADTPFLSPQSSFSDEGEMSRQASQSTHRVFAMGTMSLPFKVAVSPLINLASGRPYNVLVGYDANGDGNFNDRPRFATSGTESIPTPFGMLTRAGGIGVLPRNAGTMPWTFNIDLNANRTFPLRRQAKGQSPSLALNVRSANVLNHTNVTSVGTVLGATNFSTPYQASQGRRIELGLRFIF